MQSLGNLLIAYFYIFKNQSRFLNLQILNHNCLLCYANIIFCPSSRLLVTQEELFFGHILFASLNRNAEFFQNLFKNLQSNVISFTRNTRAKISYYCTPVLSEGTFVRSNFWTAKINGLKYTGGQKTETIGTYSRWYILVFGTFWSLEVVGYWLLANVQSPTVNNPQPQLPTTCW
ncbi:hypothetical protein BpHYR1_011886 [Brachionus plicatilis]|uniref:Uncharacterized protein n=1 Tax=Brachionus plicatilis TaxID=10195 RepID=A0A3M7RPV9_BRAPC|nr:hypothetical protein BpHYR1_011886 [Brachionus plicatilis]